MSLILYHQGTLYSDTSAHTDYSDGDIHRYNTNGTKLFITPHYAIASVGDQLDFTAPAWLTAQEELLSQLKASQGFPQVSFPVDLLSVYRKNTFILITHDRLFTSKVDGANAPLTFTSRPLDTIITFGLGWVPALIALNHGKTPLEAFSLAFSIVRGMFPCPVQQVSMTELSPIP